jgi:hypothetical protein
MVDYYPQPTGEGVLGVHILAAPDSGYVAIVYPEQSTYPWVCRVAESSRAMAETVVLLYEDWKFIMERPFKEVQDRTSKATEEAPGPEETEVGIREEGSEASRDRTDTF